jgi:hypothetical protein
MVKLNTQKMKILFSKTAIMLFFTLLASATAWADQTPVSYIDMDGKTQTVTTYTEVTNGMSLRWNEGTYVVKTSTELSGSIRFDGKVVDLILCDGATLTVNADGSFDGSRLNIYSQSTGARMGVLNANGRLYCISLNIAGGKVTINGGSSYGLYFYGGDNSGLTVNGGDVSICNNSDNPTIYLYYSSSIVTINGGKLTVTGSNGTYGDIDGMGANTINFKGGIAEINGDISGFKNINLSGGNVTVDGVVISDGEVTYDYTHATDSYYIQSFNVESAHTVKVTDGKTMTDGTNLFTGTLNDKISTISGKTLKPIDLHDVSYAIIDGLSHVYRYDGSPISIDYSVKYINGTELVKGTDYTETLSAAKVQDKGYYTLTIKGIGDYYGENIYNILVSDYNPVTSEMEGGIYAVVSDMIIDEPINVKGDATIFIVNGATLTANAGITIDDDFTLTLEGTGTLNTIGTNGENGRRGSLCAKGGKGSDGNPGISGKVIVKGVTLNATGGNGGNGGQGGQSTSGRNSYGGDGGQGGNGGAAISGTLTVNGGTVNAYGGIGGNGGAVGPRRAGGGHPGKNKGANGSDAPGIDGTVSYTDIAGAFAEDSNNKTEWSNLTTNSTDKQNLKVYVPTYTVTFNSNGGSPVLECAVAKGTTIAEPAIIPTRSDLDFCGWVNGNAAYDFTSAVTFDITLTAAWGITLANNDDNSSRIAFANDIDNLKVTLADRTLTKDGTWNTLCLPFSLSAEQIEGSPLAGAVIKEMDSSTSLNDGLLTLNFKNAQSIEAGKAYIVKWETKGENIANPVFNGVTVSNAALTETESGDEKVKFVGQYSPFTIDENNIHEILFIGSGNKIGYSKNPRQLKSCRAHFWVQPNGFSAGARVINLDLGDGMTTRIDLVNAEEDSNSESGMYTLDGRKVTQPTKKGVYVTKGKKIVK